jgi:hypothetical protein
MNVKLIDQTRTVVVAAQMADGGGHCGGTIDLASTPPLQVFPSTGDVSFKLVGTPAHAVESA